MALSSAIKKCILTAVKAYTRSVPVARYRFYQAVMSVMGEPPAGLEARSLDGRLFCIDLTTGMQSTLYFLGTYERTLTDIVSRLVKPGDVCVDVGANFGWYSTLFAKLSGPAGQVHAFEPVPKTLILLRENIALLEGGANVRVNGFALGVSESEARIHLFEGLTTGHASLSDQGRTDGEATIIHVRRYDDYATEVGLGNADIVKIDIEGSELFMLRGAESLFKQSAPPIFVIEMAALQTRNFEYHPNDIIDFMTAKGTYRFFRLIEDTGVLVEFSKFEEGDIGANVICIPAERSDRLESIRSFIGI